MTGLPLILAGAWAADLPALLVIEVLAVVASTSVVAGSLAILASSRRDRSGTACGEAIVWTMTWLLVVPLVSLMPVRSGTLWGEFLVELRRLASWIAPSSPLSLLTDQSWLSGAADALADRLAIMLALQAAVIVLAMAGAVESLRLREPHPRTWDLHRGYRPPVGDDPIFWREYVLPWRGSRLPLVVIHARQMLIVIRAILVLALRGVFLALGVIVPLGMAIAAGWFGYHAFREYWGLGASVPGSYQARDQLIQVVRVVTSMLGLVPMIAAAGNLAGRITIERNKKTWESLLTTPLTGPEILWSKMRVDARNVWAAGRWLIPLWLLGIALRRGASPGRRRRGCGDDAGHLAGPGAGRPMRRSSRVRRTQNANSTAGVWAMALMLVGGLTVVAPLCSGRELAELSALDARLPWLAGARCWRAPCWRWRPWPGG